MDHIVTVQDAVTAFADFMEPTNTELDAIEREMPVILADVELLDAHIVTDDDIAKRTSYALKIDAITDPATPLAVSDPEAE